MIFQMCLTHLLANRKTPQANNAPRQTINFDIGFSKKYTPATSKAALTFVNIPISRCWVNPPSFFALPVVGLSIIKRLYIIRLIALFVETAHLYAHKTSFLLFRPKRHTLNKKKGEKPIITRKYHQKPR